MYRFGGTEGYYKNLVPLLRNEIGLIPRGLAPRIINFKDFFIFVSLICMIILVDESLIYKNRCFINPKKMKENNSNSIRGRFMFIFLAIVIIGGIWFMFLRTSNIGTTDASDILVGQWLRSDGPYTIEIVEVLDEGKMTAEYFNPATINVGHSGWRVKDDNLQIYVELQDENYPGSLYELIYDEDEEKLSGTYYQAVENVTYDVGFKKK